MVENLAEKNYEFLIGKLDFSKLEGLWVAIVNGQLVSTGNDAKKVYEEAKKKHPKEIPLIGKVPPKTSFVS